MKYNMLTAMPDEATLQRYWGSAEAYLEEQRRTATYNLEANQFAAEIDPASGSLLSENTSQQTFKKHLPFSFRSLRHA